MYRQDQTEIELEDFGRPFIIVSVGAMNHIAINGPNIACRLVMELKHTINFTTFASVDVAAIANRFRCSKKTVSHALNWLFEEGIVEQGVVDDGPVEWRFTDAFGYEGTPEKLRELEAQRNAN